LILPSFFLQYSRYIDVRNALDVAIGEMQKNALDLKKASAEHYAPTKEHYVSVALLSHARMRMEQIVDILDTTSDKLQESLDSPSPSNVEDTMAD
jgi:uncharacterized protein YajQ (UPF0234 family)